MEIRIITEQELRQVVDLDEAVLQAVAQAFMAYSAGQAITPLMSIPVHQNNGEMHVKSAVIEGLPGFAVKIASGFFDNPKRGLPSGSGMMLLFDAETGFPMAVLLDHGYLTHTRTAAAGALAARALAPQRVETVGIIGAGRQGRWQFKAAQLVRPVSKALVHDLDPARAELFCREMAEDLGVACQAASAESVVRNSQLVVTTTPSPTPFLQADWLHPGLHITALGADNGHKQELYPEVMAEADVLVCDSRQQVFRLGEHSFAARAGLLTEDAPVAELGEVLASSRPGRTAEQQVSVCDLTGVGVQDTAIAYLAYSRAVQAGLGTVMER